MKKTTTVACIFAALTISLVSSSCRNDKISPTFGGFPEDVGKIIFTKCATSGCHTDASKDGAGGLSMQTWEKMFEGGTGSACVIPYRHDYSTVFYYTNTYPDLGIALSPTMPYNRTPLSREDVVTLKSWIDAGAPDVNGFVKFSDNPARKKYYVTNQGCDVVTVFDAATGLPMRYINVGADPVGIESPHMVRVSPDGQYWYVVFLGGTYFEKYRTSDDSFVARAFIGPGYWNTFTLSPDGLTAYCISYSSAGIIASVDLNTMTAVTGTSTGFISPHGSSINNSGDTLYVTAQEGSEMYKFPLSDLSAFQTYNLFTVPPAVPLKPHEIRFTPDGTKYFVTCQGTSEVRIFQTGTDALIATIPVGAMPTEMSFSATTPYMFVACMEDTSVVGRRGSVAVINYVTNTLQSVVYTGHQPHGIEVDDSKRLVYVANRNASSDGPAPHHTSVCGGRNGNVSFIDLNTLTMKTTATGGIKKVEVSADPYSVALRH